MSRICRATKEKHCCSYNGKDCEHIIFDYTDENGYELDTPVMEIWDIPNKKITYRKQLIKRVEI